MIANIFGSDGIIVLVVLVVVLFGGSQLPKLAKNLGSAGREFRKAQQEAEEEAATEAAKRSAPAPSQIGPAPSASDSSPDDDKVTLSRKELSDLLNQRQQQSGQ